MSSTFPQFTSTSQGFPTGFPGGGGGGGGGGGNGGNGGGGGGGETSGNTSIANSASLYLYTFLATLVLLLSVSGAIVVRSFILRRRHRRMVEEAMRNGTWVPPTPPARPARVDLSKKPGLWEAYLGGGGWQLGSLGPGSGKELDIGTNWKFEYSKDWESIRPIYAGYAEPVPYSGSTPNLTSLSSPAPIPTNPSAPRGDDEEHRRNTEVTNNGTTTPSLLSRARIFLNPNPSLPATSSNDNGTNSRSNSANISMTELNSNSPPTIRVAVLIAMPSPSSSYGSSSTPPSASLSSSLSSKAQPTTSHPLQSSPTPTLRLTDDEEQSLPHLEMGVADIAIGRSESSSSNWDSAHHTRREEKISYSRGSSYAEP